MTDKIEETIKEIAAKHGIAVSRDDPILILQTINDRLMKDSAQAQEELIDRFKEELEALAHRWSEDAKARAERVLNVALAASKNAMVKGMEDGAQAAAEQVRVGVEPVIRRMEKQSRQVAAMNIAAAVTALIAAGLALLSSI
ncbi:conjugal transfer protein TraM [Thiolapillus sp.]|uniref:conjugal transfer protein TraM n=2 Tax=Thiolapillus sp. TaxID=2017437 RepID=UPI0025FF4F5E|nr:conjugal transfer protein TraM [Thiolapillus sp.]